MSIMPTPEQRGMEKLLPSLTTQQTTWQEYTGRDEQIAEISSAKNGFVCRNNETDSGILTIKYGQLFSDQQEYPILNAMWEGSLKRFVDTNNTTQYWIIPADPLREMKIRQAMTGQPVWVRVHGVVHQTTNPNWNWANAEYSFTEFKD